MKTLRTYFPNILLGALGIIGLGLFLFGLATDQLVWLGIGLTSMLNSAFALLAVNGGSIQVDPRV
ncbi:MAG: hypothetical protein ACXWP5_01625 [Bdellovibrionota bacterium]